MLTRIRRMYAEESPASAWFRVGIFVFLVPYEVFLLRSYTPDQTGFRWAAWVAIVAGILGAVCFTRLELKRRARRRG